MTSPNLFLFSSPLSPERLTWLEEMIKYFFVKLNPENLLHRTKPPGDAVFTLFLTGDALYSLQDPQTLPLWEIILSMPSVRIICDLKELDLRGISIERLKMKNPEQVIDRNSLALNGQPSFWHDVAKAARQHEQPVPSTVGYLQIESPYMHSSALAAVRCLTAALEAHASVELYAYLDGIHCGHTGQQPADADNIGEALTDLCEKAAKRRLSCQVFACARCAAARGYATWDNGQGLVISACTVKPFRIRQMDEIAERFGHSHIILGRDIASIRTKKEGNSVFSLEETGRSPPITILVTDSPYRTEKVYGALTFGAACASHGIPTRIIFIEDGTYALTGNHLVDKDSRFFNIQDVINAVAGSRNLEFYSFLPSLHQRGNAKSPAMKAVLDIGISEFGQLLFSPSKESQAGHQRVIFF